MYTILQPFKHVTALSKIIPWSIGATVSYIILFPIDTPGRHSVNLSRVLSIICTGGTRALVDASQQDYPGGHVLFLLSVLLPSTYNVTGK